MRKLAIINSDSMDCSYGGVAPFMRNMHPYLSEEFEVKYYYLPNSWQKIKIPGRLKIMWYLWKKRAELRQCGFILSHVPEGSFVASFMGVPYCHIYHGNDNPMTQSRYRLGIYFAFLFEWFFKRIDKTCSLKYTVGPSFGDRKKLFNPICHSVLEKPYSERSGFIFAGRLELIKNIDRLINIYSKLPEEVRHENHFYIAGYGTQEKMLKALVDKLGLNHQIHFLGNVPNLKLVEEDSSKKIFVMASTQEGLPTAIAEAMSVGVPVISTNPGDIGLVLKNDYNGYIFPLDFKDDEYIEAIMKILGDYDRFSRAAKESSRVFESERITKSVIAEINHIIK